MPAPAILHCAGQRLALARPLVMGIVNLSTDSFSGDGRAGDSAAAIAQGLRLIEAGADLLDLGAESSRPGAAPVPAALELSRLLPVLEGLSPCPVPISVDTTKAEVMRVVLAQGAAMINDIGALEGPGALAAVAATDAAVCLMHMQGRPATMQAAPHYGDVVEEVLAYLAARVEAALAAGIGRERLLIDPGFGFGKSLEHNLLLLARLERLQSLGLPVLVGISNKSMLGAVTGRPLGERVHASVAAALLAASRGAAVLRVHDVGATVDALKLFDAVNMAGK